MAKSLHRAKQGPQPREFCISAFSVARPYRPEQDAPLVVSPGQLTGTVNINRGGIAVVGTWWVVPRRVERPGLRYARDVDEDNGVGRG